MKKYRVLGMAIGAVALVGVTACEPLEPTPPRLPGAIDYPVLGSYSATDQRNDVFEILGGEFAANADAVGADMTNWSVYVSNASIHYSIKVRQLATSGTYRVGLELTDSQYDRYSLAAIALPATGALDSTLSVGSYGGTSTVLCHPQMQFVPASNTIEIEINRAGCEIAPGSVSVSQRADVAFAPPADSTLPDLRFDVYGDNADFDDGVDYDLW
ncbi:MAG: hypothetical protein WBD02_04375, partial [Acidimicrobiia bacterium]